MSPQLKEFLTAVLLDLAENHDWTIDEEGGNNIEDCIVFDVAEKHAHLVDPPDWKFNRAREIRYEIRKLHEELQKL